MKTKTTGRWARFVLVLIMAGVMLACNFDITPYIPYVKNLAPDVELVQICYSGDSKPLWVAFKNNSTKVDLVNAKFGVLCRAVDNTSGDLINQATTISTLSVNKKQGNTMQLILSLQFPNSSLVVAARWVQCNVEYSYQGFTDPKPSNNAGEVLISSYSTAICFTPSPWTNHSNSGWLDSDPPSNFLLPVGQPTVPGLPPTPGFPPLPGQPSTPEGPPQTGCAGSPAIPFFTADPDQITQGQASMLSWGDVTNGTTGPWVQSTVINPGLGEVGSGASSRMVRPIQTTTYTLIATGCGGTATKEVTITVNPPSGGQPPSDGQPSSSGGQPSNNSGQSGCVGVPVIPYFNANPASIISGQSSTLSWGNVTNGKTGPLVRSVTIEPGLGEAGSGASSRTVTPTKTTTYTLIAIGCGGTETKQVTITVLH